MVKIKRAKQTQQKPKLGSFALDKPELNWEVCRENFSKFFPNKGFFFSHEPKQGECIVLFLEKIEKILSLRSKSKYAKTNLNFALWIEPAPFWLDCHMRKSLLTLFLRAGIKYHPQEDNFQEALLSQNFIASSKNAVYRFLFGFTEFQGYPKMAVGIGKGWNSYFKNKPDAFVCSQLISSKKKKLLAGAGTLWC